MEIITQKIHISNVSRRKAINILKNSDQMVGCQIDYCLTHKEVKEVYEHIKKVK